MPEAPSQPIKAIFFDLIGTCTNWLPRIVTALKAAPQHAALPESGTEAFALEWRAGFFRETANRYQAGEAMEDIDITHRRVLNYLLMQRGITPAHWNESVRNDLVRSWHTQNPWPDTLEALERLRRNFLVVVVANGTLRLQMDIVKSAGLPFDALLSSELLSKTKPDPAIYRRALRHVQVEPSEAIMVAAHAYDLRGASKAGMKTMYVQRSTEDPREKMEQVRKDVDFFFDGTKDREDGGLAEIASLLGT